MARWTAGLALLAALAAVQVANAFYLPGVAPQDFKKVGRGGELAAPLLPLLSPEPEGCSPLPNGLPLTQAPSGSRAPAAPRRPAERRHLPQGQQAQLDQEPAALRVLLAALLPAGEDCAERGEPGRGAPRGPH